MKLEKQIEVQFYKEFNAKQLSFFTNDKKFVVKAIKSKQPELPYDISLNVGNDILAIINFKKSRPINSFDFIKLREFALSNRIRYIIVSDGEQFEIDDNRGKGEREVFNFQTLLTRITEQPDINIKSKKNQISNLITEIISKCDLKYLKEQIDSVEKNFNGDLVFNEVNNLFSYRDPSNLNSVENKIFRLLLKENEPLKKVYRYTTLNSIFAILNSNSLRMNCLIGMNDTSEVYYAESYITNTNLDYSLAAWQTVDAHNKRFISSCSLKEDDLTQWRLYADDSKGVCLVLDINQELLNSKFILKRISYGLKNGEHPELDILKLIIARLKSELDVDFELKTLGTWRHFFKPYDYSVEEEVRLLYMLKDKDIRKGWLLTAEHGILNPFVEFKLNETEIPLHLTEIMLGPKCPEKEINKKQFEQFIRELKRIKKMAISKGDESVPYVDNLANLKVTISKIKNYR